MRHKTLEWQGITTTTGKSSNGIGETERKQSKYTLVLSVLCLQSNRRREGGAYLFSPAGTSREEASPSATATATATTETRPRGGYGGGESRDGAWPSSRNPPPPGGRFSTAEDESPSRGTDPAAGSADPEPSPSIQPPAPPTPLPLLPSHRPAAVAPPPPPPPRPPGFLQ